jgi:diguanylate cyclase (GGDEF)-like protein
LFELLGLEIENAKRYGRPLSLLILDLDHFKQVNDTFGHDAGDAVLKTTTNIVSSVLRRIDIFARYGGEEFIIALPETTLAGAAALAEKIRSAVEQHLFPAAGRITISIGAAEFAGNETDALVKRADEALYAAKRNGRNRVELAPVQYDE